MREGQHDWFGLFGFALSASVILVLLGRTILYQAHFPDARSTAPFRHYES